MGKSIFESSTHREYSDFNIKLQDSRAKNIKADVSVVKFYNGRIGGVQKKDRG